jgi:hypothetical protein
MWRQMAASLVVALLAVGFALADDVKGTLKKVDPFKRTITVNVDGKEKTFTVAQDAEVYSQARGKNNKPGAKEPVPGGVDGIKEGTALVITTIKKGDKETAISIKVEGAMKKKKDK